MTAMTYPGPFLPDEEDQLFPFGLSFYQQEGETGFEQYSTKLKDEEIFCPSSLLYNDNTSTPFDWSNFTAPYQDFDLFEFNPTGAQDLLLDTPSSSFPSSPISSFSTGSSALSPPEQQEVNDIISSLQDTATPDSTQHLSSISSTPISSPPLSPFPVTPSLPQKQAPEQFIPPTPKRTPQGRGGRKSKLSKTDKKERKKEQNKTAAVRYRQKKREELDNLTKQEMALLQSNKELKEEVDSITAEINCLKRLWGEVCQAKGIEPTLPYNSIHL
ncbi:PREDICTED: activating transcription factor of chaperone-like [Amphimedon queenslandica]|uniref:BZIP domain-containing protein n=1 Tax=Amphimedon queenslandica TaxID=400682 RepID=A0A1X7VDZ7_AMPQE|nr:PREDICTED: activating transcription factor of chaperone-like [Amphimedon queenslandica]|eukprot:XP_003384513.1 PREDICTED: activating transcription factor of chaperone-like [Amphimedon queenslandica]